MREMGLRLPLGSARRLTATVVIASGAVAVLAYFTFQPGRLLSLALLDAAVAVTLLVAGVTAFGHPAARGPATLLVVTGVAWLAGSVFPGAIFWHRGPLIHLQLTYPSSRATWLPTIAVITAGYLIAFTPQLARDARVTLSLALVVSGTSLAGYLRSRGPARRRALPGLISAQAFAVVLLLAAANSMGGWQADRTVLTAYDLVVLLTALGLRSALLRGHWIDDVVADLVIDLGSRADGGFLRDELARALGDRSLVLGYSLDGDGRFIDDVGQPISLSEGGEARSVTWIPDRANPLAVLVHKPMLFEDGTLLSGVTAAAAVAISNARLQASIRKRLDELEASRRRLVEVGDEQRRHLADEIQVGVQRHLAKAAERLAVLRATSDDGMQADLTQLQADLARVCADIDGLARGIRPQLLTELGLEPALVELRTSHPVRVDVDARVPRLPDALEAAVYFLCCEGLANATKHASASHVTISVRCDEGRVTVDVADNGRGGALVGAGSGLRGVQDRLGAVGGHLTVASSDQGTVLHAVIDLEPNRGRTRVVPVGVH